MSGNPGGATPWGLKTMDVSASNGTRTEAYSLRHGRSRTLLGHEVRAARRSRSPRQVLHDHADLRRARPPRRPIPGGSQRVGPRNRRRRGHGGRRTWSRPASGTPGPAVPRPRLRPSRTRHGTPPTVTRSRRSTSTRTTPGVPYYVANNGNKGGGSLVPLAGGLIHRTNNSPSRFGGRGLRDDRLIHRTTAAPRPPRVGGLLFSRAGGRCRFCVHPQSPAAGCGPPWHAVRTLPLPARGTRAAFRRAAGG